MKQIKNEIIIDENLPLGALTIKQFRELMLTLPNNSSFPPSAPLEDLMKLPEVLSFLKISRSTLFSWKKQGVVKAHTIRGTLFFKRSEIMELFQSTKLKK